MANYPSYLGFDISPIAVEFCRKKFAEDNTKRFAISGNFEDINETFDLAMSLDVTYHLVEDDVFECYMRELFSLSKRYVVIYSSNFESVPSSPHVRHRQFTNWIEANAKGWSLLGMEPNRYPFDPNSPDETSFADFYFYISDEP